MLTMTDENLKNICLGNGILSSPLHGERSLSFCPCLLDGRAGEGLHWNRSRCPRRKGTMAPQFCLKAFDRLGRPARWRKLPLLLKSDIVPFPWPSEHLSYPTPVETASHSHCREKSNIGELPARVCLAHQERTPCPSFGGSRVTAKEA